LVEKDFTRVDSYLTTLKVFFRLAYNQLRGFNNSSEMKHRRSVSQKTGILRHFDIKFQR